MTRSLPSSGRDRNRLLRAEGQVVSDPKNRDRRRVVVGRPRPARGADNGAPPLGDPGACVGIFSQRPVRRALRVSGSGADTLGPGTIRVEPSVLEAVREHGAEALWALASADRISLTEAGIQRAAELALAAGRVGAAPKSEIVPAAIIIVAIAEGRKERIGRIDVFDRPTAGCRFALDLWGQVAPGSNALARVLEEGPPACS
jgi:hypothetical protein